MRLLSDTKKIEIGEAVFTIGIVNRLKWLEISSRREMAFRKFRNLYSAVASAIDPSKLTPEELQSQAADLSKKALEGMTDEEIHKANMEMVKAHWDLIRHGVVAHSGIKDRDGSEIPFKKDDGGVASDSVIGLYELCGFFTKLAEEVRAFNEQSEQDKKN